MKKWIPNIVTLTNLFFGCCALAALFEQQFFWVIVFLLAGAIADFLDGFVARLLSVQSELGKELDSLADMVTFGLVPGAIVFVLMNLSLSASTPPVYDGWSWIATTAFLITIFSCIRLAIFNTHQSDSADFTGLATPANTSFIGGMLAIFHYDSFGLASWVCNFYFLLGTTLLFSFLLVAKLPMFSLKFRGSSWSGNEWRYVFCVGMLILFFLFREVGFSLVIVLYLLLSIIRTLTGRKI